MNQNYQVPFKGTAELIRIVTSIDIPESYTSSISLQQRLTICKNGSVSYVSTNRNKEVIESLNIFVDENLTLEIIDRVSRYFSKPVNHKHYPVIGNYDLTISNSNGENYYYDGSLNNHYTIDGENISDFIRLSLNLPQLYVFENHVLKKHINQIEINLYQDNERVILDRHNQMIFYQYNKNQFSLNECDEVLKILENYEDKFQIDYKFVTNTYEGHEYDVKVKYSYGDDFCFGGKFSADRIPYYLGDLLDELKNLLISKNFGSLFEKRNYSFSSTQERLALVTSNELTCNEWFPYCSNLDICDDDIVLVCNNIDSYFIGRVICTKLDDSYHTTLYRNKRVIKKI